MVRNLAHSFGGMDDQPSTASSPSSFLVLSLAFILLTMHVLDSPHVAVKIYFEIGYGIDFIARIHKKR